MVWVTEFVAFLIVAGALALLGLGKIDFQQSLTLITLGLGLLAGKQLGRADHLLEKRYARLYLMRRFNYCLTALSVSDNTVRLHILPEFLNTPIEKKIASIAAELFPGKTVEVVRGERIRAV